MKTDFPETLNLNDNGFSLIDALISLAILSIGILAVASLQVSASLQSRNSLEITEGTAIASSQMEELMLRPFDHSDLDPASNPHTAATIPTANYSIPPNQFNIQWTVTATDQNGDGVNEAKTVVLTVVRNTSGANERQVRLSFIKHNDLVL
jgi:type IV pilus assembly protein PilV